MEDGKTAAESSPGGLLRVCEVHMSLLETTFHTADPDIFGGKKKKSGGEGCTRGRKSEGEMRNKKIIQVRMERTLEVFLFPSTSSSSIKENERSR